MAPQILTHVLVLISTSCCMAMAEYVPFTIQNISSGVQSSDLHVNVSSCPALCQRLSSTYNGQIAFPNSSVYSSEQNEYWSTLQSSQQPACFFSPKSSQDVSAFVKLATETGCIFALKCGGNGPYANYSSISNGITVDMISMGSMSLIEDNSKIAMSCCSTWGDVYKFLEMENKTTFGVRNSRIGNCGSLQGGAISWEANKVGWGLNNVLQYEVVLADGSIVNASQSVNPEIYEAMKGSGTNVGIATKVTMPTVEQGNMWNGMVLVSGSASLQVADAFVDFTVNGIPSYLNASMWVTGAFIPPSNGTPAVPIISIQMFDISGQPANGAAFPEIFAPFFKLPGVILNTTVVAPPSAVSVVIEDILPAGLGEYYCTWSTGLNAKLLDQSMQLFFMETAGLANENNIPSYTYQHVSEPSLKAMRDRGGSPLGIERFDQPFQISYVGSAMMNNSNLPKVISISNDIKAQAVFMAEELDEFLEYEYTNYASECQFPMRSYGLENFEFIKDVAQRYDPRGVFQTLLAGGPKLEPAPPPMCFPFQ